jgi:adenylate kinase
MHVILFGPPGSGKGTQSKVIENKLGLRQLSTGDLVRREIEDDTPTGRTISKSVSQGVYPPDKVIFDLFRGAFGNIKSGFIFDGFPRTLNQVKLLEDFLAERGEDVSIVIMLDVRDEELIKRLSGRFSCKSCGTLYNDYSKPLKVANSCDVCGGSVFERRSDDKEDAVKMRLKVYKTQTEPLISYFADANKLVRINGEKEPALISADILECLESLKSEQDVVRSM